MSQKKMSQILKEVDSFVDGYLWNLHTLLFSRVYGRKKSACKHISGRMAHRLYLQGELLTDELSNDAFINGTFRAYDDEQNIFIQQSYLNYIMKEQFQTRIKCALSKTLIRLTKGFGFSVNCIAERVLAFILIDSAQDALLDGTELYVLDQDFAFYNSWPIERVRESKDANFAILMEKECGIKIDRQEQAHAFAEPMRIFRVDIDQ
eukprot:UN07736